MLFIHVLYMDWPCPWVNSAEFSITWAAWIGAVHPSAAVSTGLGVLGDVAKINVIVFFLFFISHYFSLPFLFGISMFTLYICMMFQPEASMFLCCGSFRQEQTSTQHDAGGRLLFCCLTCFKHVSSFFMPVTLLHRSMSFLRPVLLKEGGTYNIH